MATPTRPCSACGTPIPLPMSEKSYAMNYIARTSTVLTLRGRKESIMQPLVSSYGRPTGGWYVNIYVKSVAHRINGNSANAVFSQTKELLRTNGLVVSDLNIWLNLNIQWYDRLPEKFMVVKRADLLAVAVPRAELQPNQLNVNESRNYSPANWGSVAWDFLGVYLAQDIYSWDRFSYMLDNVRTMLSNDTNPSIGCNECYLEFTKEVDQLRQSPKYNVEDARDWLFNFHNSVNVRLKKPIVSREIANKRYLWK